MFGVEDGQVLVGDHFEPSGADRARQLGHLRGVEIVGGREALQAQLQKGVGREHVGGVEAEVADQRRA